MRLLSDVISREPAKKSAYNRKNTVVLQGKRDIQILAVGSIDRVTGSVYMLGRKRIGRHIHIDCRVVVSV